MTRCRGRRCCRSRARGAAGRWRSVLAGVARTIRGRLLLPGFTARRSTRGGGSSMTVSGLGFAPLAPSRPSDPGFCLRSSATTWGRRRERSSPSDAMDAGVPGVARIPRRPFMSGERRARKSSNFVASNARGADLFLPPCAPGKTLLTLRRCVEPRRPSASAQRRVVSACHNTDYESCRRRLHGVVAIPISSTHVAADSRAPGVVCAALDMMLLSASSGGRHVDR